MDSEKLQSRLDQQSNLICMLKQRNDRTTEELSQVTSKYESSCHHLESLQESLSEQSRKCKLIEKRFYDLAKNHEQMIHYKDQYKEEAQRLRCELMAGEKEVKGRALEEEMMKVGRQWEDKIVSVERQLTLAEEQRFVAETTASQLQIKMRTSAKEHSEIVQQLQASLTAVQEENLTAKEECRTQNKQLQQVQSQVVRIENNSTTQLQQALGKITALEKELVLTKEKEREWAERLDRDAPLLSLRRQLHCSQETLLSVQKEYEAFKLHSGELLAHERKLNEQLRHVLE